MQAENGEVLCPGRDWKGQVRVVPPNGWWEL